MSANCCNCCVIVFGFLVVVALLGYALMNAMTPRDYQNMNANGTRANQTLKFLVVVSRHGNRGPLYTFPNNPYPVNDTRYWPYGMSNLTPYGRVQMYNLGVKIRSLYNGFLKNEFYDSDLYATSTVMDRTLMSGEAFLAGLYPPVDFQRWNKNILWQPIPLYSDSLDKTAVIGLNCPRFVQATTEAVTEYLERNGANISLVNAYLSKYAGQNLTTFMDFFHVWDPFICEVTEGYVLPDWSKKVYPEAMSDIAGKSYIAYFVSTTETTRLLIGSFLDQMLGAMKSKINGTLTPDRYLYFYSGHDATLLALQVVLGIPRSSIINLVNPGSAMIYELHQDPNTHRYSIQVLYIDGSYHTLEPVSLNIPGCGTSCDFNQLVSITQEFCNVNYEDECKINQTLIYTL